MTKQEGRSATSSLYSTRITSSTPHTMNKCREYCQHPDSLWASAPTLFVLIEKYFK